MIRTCGFTHLQPLVSSLWRTVSEDVPMSDRFFSLVLLDAARRLDMAALVLQIRQLTAPIGLSVELLRDAQGAEPAMVGVGGVPLTVIAQAAPVPPGTMEQAVAASLAWPESGAAVEAHGAHLIVGCVEQPADHEQALHFAMVTTFVTAAALDVSDGLGVYWASGEMMLSPEGMREAVRAMLSKSLPVEDWVNLMWFRDEMTGQGQAIGAATLGARHFFGMEIEFLPAPKPPVDVAQRIFGLVRYLLAHGAVVKDGDTIGESETDITRVRFLDRGMFVPGRVLQLAVETRGEEMAMSSPASQSFPEASGEPSAAPLAPAPGGPAPDDQEAEEALSPAPAAPASQYPEAMVAFPDPAAGTVPRRPVFGRRGRT
ncbi:DUF4261 domain-containing protein [Stappia sp.]|uniref:DUF4261 domain-containing protein n=1 Tax=Stappia sp. TaxID=1870903 RepID=UPI003D113057